MLSMANNNNTLAVQLLKFSQYGYINELRQLLEQYQGIDIVNIVYQDWSLLTAATSKDQNETVHFLLNHGANVNWTNRKNQSALIIACKHNYSSIVKMLLQHGADINCQLKDGTNSFLRAVKSNHLETVKILLDHGADVTYATSEGLTALMIAAKYTSVEMVQSLLSMGAEITINEKDCNEWTALWHAIYHDDCDIIQLLLNNQADVNSKNLNKQTGLMLALQLSKLHVADILLENGAILDHVDVDGCSLLMSSSYNGSYCAAEWILQKGTDINKSNGQGTTALMFAVQKNHFDIVELLIVKGANVNCINARSWTSLMLASQYKEVSCLKLLIEKGGADVNFTNTLGWNALKIATYYGHQEIVEFLYSKGAIINCLSESTFHVLNVALYKGHSEIIKFLAKHLANINQTNDKGITFLMAARFSINSGNMIPFLLEQGADVNAVDKCGRSALLHACSNGNLKAVQVLCRNGANLGAFDKWGLNCVMNACRNGHLKILNELVQNQNCDVNAISHIEFDPILFDSKTESKPSVRSNIDEPVEIITASACTIAAICGHKECVEYLFAKNVTVSDDMKDTAMKKAAERGYHDISSLLQLYIALYEQSSIKSEKRSWQRYQSDSAITNDNNNHFSISASSNEAISCFREVLPLADGKINNFHLHIHTDQVHAVTVQNNNAPLQINIKKADNVAFDNSVINSSQHQACCK